MFLHNENGEYPGDYTIPRAAWRLSCRTRQRRPRTVVHMTLPRTPAVVMAATSLVLVFLTAAPLPPARALPQVIKVGVVDFYAQTPLGTFSGVFPERFAADDLSGLLARAPAGRFDVIPRATMQQAEGAMRWQEADVLHFDRLRALARAVGADRLVVGWIPQLVVEAGGGGGSTPMSSDGGGPPNAFVNIVVQVFDGAEARVVAETHQSADIIGASRSQLATQVLHTALERALPDVLRLLTGP